MISEQIAFLTESSHRTTHASSVLVSQSDLDRDSFCLNVWFLSQKIQADFRLHGQPSPQIMTEKYSSPHRCHLSWIQSLNVLTLVIYLLTFMEWLFHVTKPSFLSMLELREKVSLLFVAPLPLLVFATFVLTLGWSLGFFLPSSIGRAVQVWTGRCLSVLFLAATLILVTDNFTYTLFGISVGNSHILMFLPYMLLITVLAVCGIRSMEQRIARRGSATMFYGTTILLTALSFFFWVGGRERFKPRIVLNANGGQRPNIVLVSGDGIDASRMSIYGFERETTPFLRQLKESALFFENALPNAATTTASVTSMLTGKLATKTQVIYPPAILRGKDAYEHLPGILKRLGYSNLEISIRHYSDPIDLNMRGAFDRSNFRDTHGMDLAERLERWIGQEPSPNVTKTQAVYASAVAIRWYVRRVSLLFIKRSLIAPLGRTSTAARFRRTKRKV